MDDTMTTGEDIDEHDADEDGGSRRTTPPRMTAESSPSPSSGTTTTIPPPGSASSPPRSSSSYPSSGGGGTTGDLSGMAAAAASAAISSSNDRRGGDGRRRRGRGRIRSRPGGETGGGDAGGGTGPWRHAAAAAASSSLLDTSAASVSDDEEDDIGGCSSSTPMSSEGANRENDPHTGVSSLDSLPSRTPLRGFPPEADRKRVVGCLAAVLAVLQSHHDAPGDDDDDDDENDQDDPSSSPSYLPPSDGEGDEGGGGENDDGDGIGGRHRRAAAFSGAAPSADRGGADRSAVPPRPPRRGGGEDGGAGNGNGNGTGNGTVVGSADAVARYRRRRSRRSAALLRRAASLLFLDASHARALEPILALRLAPPPEPPTRAGDGDGGEVRDGDRGGVGPAGSESPPSRGDDGAEIGRRDYWDLDERNDPQKSGAHDDRPPTRRELLTSPRFATRPPPPHLSCSRVRGSLLSPSSSPDDDDEGRSESESSQLVAPFPAPPMRGGQARTAYENEMSSRPNRDTASSVAPGLGSGGPDDDDDAAAATAAASLVRTLLGGPTAAPASPKGSRQGPRPPSPGPRPAFEPELSPPRSARSRRSELMDGLMTGAGAGGTTECEAAAEFAPPPSALFADAPPIVADGDAVCAPDHRDGYQGQELERAQVTCRSAPGEARAASPRHPPPSGGTAIVGTTTYEELIGPFLSQLSPRSGYRCVALLLCHHLLKSPEGYDSRVRHALKTLAVVILCQSHRGRRGLLPDGEAERAGVSRATREFESLERAVGRGLLRLSSSQSSSSSSSPPTGVADGGGAAGVVRRNDGGGGGSGGGDVAGGDPNATAAVVPAPAPSSRHLSTTTTASSARPTRDQILRGIKITSAGLMAGTLFAVTGGLAAPGIAAGIAAVTAGTTAAATAGTTTAAVISTLSTPAAVTAVFGVGGGGLVGYKVQRRTRGLTEFEFRRHDAGGGADDDDKGKGKNEGEGRRCGPPPPEMFTAVCLSGWLTDANDFDRPWGATRRPRKMKARSMAWRRLGPRGSKSERATPPKEDSRREGGSGYDGVEEIRRERHRPDPSCSVTPPSTTGDSHSTSLTTLSPHVINLDSAANDNVRGHHPLQGCDQLCQPPHLSSLTTKPPSHEEEQQQQQQPRDIHLCILEQFYLRHNRGNVDRATSILQQWRGEEDDLWALLRDKYGSDPLEEYFEALAQQRQRQRGEQQQQQHPSPKRGGGDGIERHLQRGNEESSDNHGRGIAEKCSFGREGLTNSASPDVGFVGAEEVEDVLNVLFEELGYSLPQEERQQHQQRVGHSKLGGWRRNDASDNRQTSSSSTSPRHGNPSSPPSNESASHPPSSPLESPSSSHPNPGSSTVMQSRSGGSHHHYQRHTSSRSRCNRGAASTVLTNSSSPAGPPSTMPLSSGLASPPPGNCNDEDYGSNVASSGGLGGADAKSIPTDDDTPADDAGNPQKKNRKVRWDYSSVYAGELYTVRWESHLLMELCDSVTDLAIDMVGGATTHILKQTALHTLLSAFAWPYALINAANMIDGTWTLAIERADAAGVELARTLLEGEAGHRPVTLMGFSMGARAIYSCLKELARHQELWEDERDEEIKRRHERRRRCQSEVATTEGVGNGGSCRNTDDTTRLPSSYSREPASIVEDAILMGCPNHLSVDSWAACRRVVAGRLVNCYSRRDLILSLMFQYKRVTGIRLRPVCGTCPVDVAGVENYNVSSLISSHEDYCHEVRNILGMVRYGQPRPQLIPPPPTDAIQQSNETITSGSIHIS